MNTASASVYAWKDIPWRKLERALFKLQTRIYRAKQRGDVQAVRKLQRLLVTSRTAKLIAVRRVTQDNRGKKTAGIDGVKALTPSQRLTLARDLRLTSQIRPVRRIWIPKRGTNTKRPLGIPVMRDRAAQALLKQAMEPEWEAVFEPNSYGFRPGRAPHDAIEAIFTGICLKPKYVLDADITKCFDRIDHDRLLAKLNTTPTFRRVIRAWLKAEVMDGDTLFPSKEGTPQGGVISPLLANIALHGLETAVLNAFPKRQHVDGRREMWKPVVVRYSDDFVVMHQDRASVERAKVVVTAWLRDLGLELHPEKTRIVHTLRGEDGQAAGFDFLGFTVRQYPTGKTHSARVNRGYGLPPKLLGCKTIITPSKTALKRHDDAMRETVRQYRDGPQGALIARLAPLIRGWSAYYATVPASKAFRRMDHQLHLKLWRWATRRHPTMSRRWVGRKYWHTGHGHWCFRTTTGARLPQHAQTRRRPYAKVRGAKSPYDGDWGYWGARLSRHPAVPQRVGYLLRRQRGKCARCGLSFQLEDHWEIDHRVPTADGGVDRAENWQLLHGHCHHAKTAEEFLGQGTPDKEPAHRGAV